MSRQIEVRPQGTSARSGYLAAPTHRSADQFGQTLPTCMSLESTKWSGLNGQKQTATGRHMT